MAVNINGGTTKGPTPGTLARFSSIGNVSAGPPNATPWDALKDIGFEAVGIIILSVIAGTGQTGANFALGFLVLLWLLAIIAHPKSA